MATCSLQEFGQYISALSIAGPEANHLAIELGMLAVEVVSGHFWNAHQSKRSWNHLVIPKFFQAL